MTDRLVELISAERIERRIGELAAQINEDYADRSPLIVGVLKGCFVFLADLVRRLNCAPEIDFMRATSYGSATETSGIVEIRKDLETSVAGRDVLLVEDVVDTGLTLDYLSNHLRAGRPRSIKVCALLDKPSCRRVEFVVDYVGFEIGPEFVVGFGLDFDDHYRELPSICVLKHESRD